MILQNPSSPAPRLLVIYNADGGILNMLKDAIWKVAKPETYPCSLCAITYGAVSMHSDWRRFLDSLKLDVVFHHKDDFAEAYPDHGIALPAIAIASENGALETVVSASELDTISGTGELIAQVQQRLVAHHARDPGLRIVA
ncbi:MAG: hypothetical protein AAF697_12205 [Pseudomonadota bacterium]